MTTKYGYEQHEWDAAKAEMREALVERAKVRGMIPYSELVERITAIELEPNSFALAAMLGEVSTEEDAADRGMLSVIVVHKVGDISRGRASSSWLEHLVGIPRISSSAGHQRDYHAVDLGPSVDRMGVEKALATVEGQQAAVLRRILDEQNLPPEDDVAIADLMAFVALMAVRIPRFRELVSDFIDRAEKAQARAMFASEAGQASFRAAMDALLPTLGPLKRKEVENLLGDDPDLAKMAEFVNSDSYRISYGRDEQDRTWDVQTMLRMSIVLIPVLAERHWSLWLVSDNGPDLVCSDSPVYLGWTKQVSGLYPPGFGVPETIVTVPLSRRVALVGMFEPLPKRRDIGEAEVARLNLSTVMYGSNVYSAEPNFVWLTSDGRIGNKQDLLGSDDGDS